MKAAVSFWTILLFYSLLKGHFVALFCVDSLFKFRVSSSFHLFFLQTKPNIKMFICSDLTDSLCQVGVLSLLMIFSKQNLNRCSYIFSCRLFIVFQTKNIYCVPWVYLLVVNKCWRVLYCFIKPAKQKNIAFSSSPWWCFYRKTKPKNTRLISFLALNVGWIICFFAQENCPFNR
jgi:hypothetical protein